MEVVWDNCVGSSLDGHQGESPCKPMGLPAKTGADGSVDGGSYGKGATLYNPAETSTDHNASSFTAERADHLVRSLAFLLHRRVGRNFKSASERVRTAAFMTIRSIVWQVLDADYQQSGSRGIWFFSGLQNPSRDKRKNRDLDAEPEGIMPDPMSRISTCKKLCDRRTPSPGRQSRDQHVESEECTDASPGAHAEESPETAFASSSFPGPFRSQWPSRAEGEEFLTDYTEVGHSKFCRCTILQ
jgi:hypothetical protein